MYTSSTIMNFILEGKICFTETEWKCKTSLLRSLGDNFERGAKVVEYTLLESEDKENQKGE